MNDFRIAYKMTADNYVQGTRLLSLNSFWVKILLFVFVPVFTPVFIVFGIILKDFIFVICALPLLIFPLALFVLQPRQLRKLYGVNKSLAQEIEISFHGDGGHSITVGDTVETHNKSEIHTIINKKGYVLIRLKALKNFARIIPERAFIADQMAQFQQWKKIVEDQ